MVAVALFLAHQAINTPARVPVMREVPAPLAAENIQLVNALQAISGKMELVFHLVQYAKLAICIIATTPALLTRLVAKPYLVW